MADTQTKTQTATMQLTLKNASGKDAGTIELDDAVFGVQPNVPLMHQVVTAQLAARRSGTQSTKSRADVRGGGRKPYAQKGTGNARQGSIRAPQFTGGGVALGPKPRKYNQKTPKKMIKAALRSALSDRATEGKVIVVDSYGFDSPKTKNAKALLAALDISGTVLVVVGRDDANAALSFRNLPSVQVISPGELNTYDVLCNDWIVFSKDVVPAAEGPSAAAKVQTAQAETAAAAEITASGDTDADGEADEIDATPYGEGSHGPIDGDEMPDGFPIKGNADSMLYHLPDTAFYDRTIAEVWFATEGAAEAAGFARPASQVDTDSANDDAAESEA